MDYLVAQIAVFLVLAALLGAAVGWLLRRPARAVPDLSADLAAANQRIEKLERSLAVYETARPVTAPAEAARPEAL